MTTAVLPQKDARGEFARGWTVLLAAMIGNGLGLVALPFYTIGALAPILRQQYGWSFAQIMAGIPIVSGVAMVLSPVVGVLTDRIGVRRVALFSLPMFGFSFALFAANPGSLGIYYLNWVVLGVFGSGCLPLVWTRAVNNWFDKNKGLALGITMMGSGLFGSLAKLVVAYVQPTWGWQACYLVIALAPTGIAFPLAWFAFHDRKASLAEGDALVAPLPGADPRDIIRDWRFWMIGIAFLFLSLGLGGPMPHLENLLFDKGFSRTGAAEIAAVFGVAVVVGRVSGGLLLDRFWAPAIAVILFLSPAIGLALFNLNPGVTWVAMLMIVLFGLGCGVEYDLMSFLIARYFGMRHYGYAFGSLYLIFGIGSGIGPVAVGWAYDVQGSYTTVLWISVSLLVVSSIMLLTLGRYAYGLHSEVSLIDDKQ